ncbi:MAG: phosphotransferase [Deltaproteobacteria bacterium]|nr:phosphotransferase [Deltaproteobacteria bacterium]
MATIEQASGLGSDPLTLRRAVERHLRERDPHLRVIAVHAIGSDTPVADPTYKASGYGVPLLVVARSLGDERRYVLHFFGANGHGHERGSDRVAEALLAADTYPRVLGHVKPVDVGVIDAVGRWVSLAHTGEPFLLTEWRDGSLDVEELRALAERGEATGDDRERVRAMVRYLERLHVSVPHDGTTYLRAVRDMVGHGEGVFGILDGYPRDVPAAPTERLRAIERAVVDWRWKLKERAERLRRIHGDFHPFNVLFDADGEVVVLDASRGSLGEPADDLAAMAVNYVFFALDRPHGWSRGFGVLWRDLFDGYLAAVRDPGVLEVIAPHLAWRALVLASPRWYPKLSAAGRDRLLRLAEEALREPRFDPVFAEELMR